MITNPGPRGIEVINKKSASQGNQKSLVWVDVADPVLTYNNLHFRTKWT